VFKEIKCREEELLEAWDEVFFALLLSLVAEEPTECFLEAGVDVWLFDHGAFGVKTDQVALYGLGLGDKVEHFNLLCVLWAAKYVDELVLEADTWAELTCVIQLGLDLHPTVFVKYVFLDSFEHHLHFSFTTDAVDLSTWNSSVSLGFTNHPGFVDDTGTHILSLSCHIGPPGEGVWKSVVFKTRRGLKVYLLAWLAVLFKFFNTSAYQNSLELLVQGYNFEATVTLNLRLLFQTSILV
jgi:hypothetical protein